MASTMMMGLLAETFVHPGSGQTDGAIDLRVAREGGTDYPYVPGSSLKGALKTLLDGRNSTDQAIKDVFGSSDVAGDILVSDARLALLPVRSLSAAYYWLTCPLLLERLGRDRARVLRVAKPLPAVTVEPETVRLAASSPQGENRVFLEERLFTVKAPIDAAHLEALKSLLPGDGPRDRVEAQVAVVSDVDFRWFAKNALPVQARNVLDEQKSSINLWYEETLPPDTLLYTSLSSRDPGQDQSAFFQSVLDKAYVQVGGNETVGQGWFRMLEVTV